jgi:hypothetical protein
LYPVKNGTKVLPQKIKTHSKRRLPSLRKGECRIGQSNNPGLSDFSGRYARYPHSHIYHFFNKHNEYHEYNGYYGFNEYNRIYDRYSYYIYNGAHNKYYNKHNRNHGQYHRYNNWRWVPSSGVHTWALHRWYLCLR